MTFSFDRKKGSKNSTFADAVAQASNTFTPLLRRDTLMDKTIRKARQDSTFDLKEANTLYPYSMLVLIRQDKPGTDELARKRKFDEISYRKRTRLFYVRIEVRDRCFLHFFLGKQNSFFVPGRSNVN